MTYPLIKCAIYDLDGLLLDTERFYTEVTQKIVGKYGKTFDWSVKSKILGRKSHESATIIVDSLQLPITPDEYLDARNEMLFKLFPYSEPLPGVLRLVHHLAEHGIKQGVASSTKRKMLNSKIQRHQDWFSLFEIIVTGDDPEVKEGKPAPDIFLVAARRMGVDPHECLVFEDAPTGTQAALSAGMRVIAVPDPNMDHALYPGASALLGSLEEFCPELWGLPEM